MLKTIVIIVLFFIAFNLYSKLQIMLWGLKNNGYVEKDVHKIVRTVVYFICLLCILVPMLISIIMK